MIGGTILRDLLQSLNTEELASLGPDQRASASSLAELDAQLKPVFQDIRLTPALKDLFRSIIYLWHDHLDASHQLAQAIETADGSLVHAIMHRREPDYFNSKYWFRRVGSHPSFLSLAMKAGDLLDKADESDLRSRLLPNRTWDPFAFVDAVEDACAGQFPSRVPLLQQIQRLEFECLLENLAYRL